MINVLIAGTSEEVFRSEDGGQTSIIADENKIITAISAVPNSMNLLGHLKGMLPKKHRFRCIS